MSHSLSGKKAVFKRQKQRYIRGGILLDTQQNVEVSITAANRLNNELEGVGSN